MEPDGIDGPCEFVEDARAVLGRLKTSFGNVIAAAGMKRAVDVQHLLGLDKTLSWQVFRIATERDVLTVGNSIPSKAAIKKFADAASAAGVGREQVAAVLRSSVEVERLVKQHAGDRTSFISLVTAAGGLSDEWLAADLQHRRNTFRAFSHMVGFQSEARLMTLMFAKNARQNAYNFACVSGHVGFRMLRSRPTVRVFGYRVDRFNLPDDAPDMPRVGPLVPGGRFDGYMLDEFSSPNLPEILMQTGQRGNAYWTEGLLVRPPVGNRGVSTLMFGNYNPSVSCPRVLSSTVTMPTKACVIDLLVQPGCWQGGIRRMKVFLSGGSPDDQHADEIDLQGAYTAEYLGRGTDCLVTPDVPKYSEMIDTAAKRFETPTEFDAYRVRIDFPVYQSVIRFYLDDEAKAQGVAAQGVAPGEQ